MAKYIGTVFAVGGDMTYPPDSATDGSVNLNTGYTPQYEIDLASGDPTAKAVERNVMNGLFNWLFDNQSFDQAHGLAPWFSNYSGGYPINALVADNSTGTWQIYRSLIAANTDIPTLATSWELVFTQTEMLNRNPFALGGAKGSSSGSIATGTNLNSWSYSQGTWVVTTDAIAANITNLPSSRQGVLIARNTTTAYNPANNAAGGSFLQMYFDADGKVYVRFYAIPSSGTTQTWTAWRTIAFLDSPAFTGAPTAPTAAAGTNTTQIASTEFVTNAITNETGRLIRAPQAYQTAGTFSYVPPAGCKFIKAIVTGGGGGGGGSAGTTTSNTISGAGGGGGGTTISYLAVDPSVTYSLVVGAGGAAGSGSAGGAAGGASYIRNGSTTISSAAGGGAASWSGSGSTGGGTGGQGTSTYGIAIAGGSGSDGQSGSMFIFAGNGGGSFWGGGARSGNGNGGGGLAPGAGGAGAYGASGSTNTGGKGKDGIIYIEEYY